MAGRKTEGQIKQKKSPDRKYAEEKKKITRCKQINKKQEKLKVQTTKQITGRNTNKHKRCKTKISKQ